MNALGDFLKQYWTKKPGLIAEIEERAKALAPPIEGDAKRVPEERAGGGE